MRSRGESGFIRKLIVVRILLGRRAARRACLDRPQVLLEAPRRHPVDVVARGRAVLDAARGHVKGVRLHGVARELLVQIRIEIPGPT